MHARLSPLAQRDLDTIHGYIAADSVRAAHRIVDAIFSSIAQLESFPLLGRPGRIESTRELIVPRTPYLVVYTLPDEFHVDVERILHSARKFPPED